MRGLMNMKNKLLSSSRNISCLTELSKEIIFRSTSPRFLCLKAYSTIYKSGEENDVLVSTLTAMGVDINLVRKRQPGVLRKKTINDDLQKFLHSKGFCRETIATIISRYPRCITRSHDSLQNRWEIWKNILESDLDVIKILERSPECFFRSQNNENMEKNIALFFSLGLTSKDLAKMLMLVPRAFSNTVGLNKQKVDLLREICIELGGENPADFAKQIISKNAYILLQSRKQMTANFQLLKSYLRLENEELRTLLQGEGGEILHLSNEYLKKNLAAMKKKMISHGCTEADAIKFFCKHICVLYTSPQKINDKIDILLQANINLHEILKSSLILDKSIKTLSSRIDALRKVGYDFETQTIGILKLSKPKFKAKLEKMQCM